MVWWLCVVSSFGVWVCSVFRLVLCIVWCIFSNVLGCRLNLFRFSVSSSGVIWVLLVILLQIVIGMWWCVLVLIIICSSCSMVGCSGEYSLFSVLLLWLVVSRYCIRLLVLIDRKLIRLMKFFSVSVVVGILIIVFSGMWLDIMWFLLCSCLVSLSMCWCMVSSFLWVLIIGISMCSLLYVDVCRIVCSWVLVIFGCVSERCILCRLSVGFFLLFRVRLVWLVLFVFRFSVCMVIGCLFMFSVVLWQVWNCFFLFGSLLCCRNRNLVWYRLSFCVFSVCVWVMFFSDLVLVSRVMLIWLWVWLGLLCRWLSLCCLCVCFFSWMWQFCRLLVCGLMVMLLLVLLMISMLLLVMWLSSCGMLMIRGRCRLCVRIVLCDSVLLVVVMMLIMFCVCSCVNLEGVMLLQIRILLVRFFIVDGCLGCRKVWMCLIIWLRLFMWFFRQVLFMLLKILVRWLCCRCKVQLVLYGLLWISLFRLYSSLGLFSSSVCRLRNLFIFWFRVLCRCWCSLCIFVCVVFSVWCRCVSLVLIWWVVMCCLVIFSVCGSCMCVWFIVVLCVVLWLVSSCIGCWLEGIWLVCVCGMFSCFC